VSRISQSLGDAGRLVAYARKLEGRTTVPAWVKPRGAGTQLVATICRRPGYCRIWRAEVSCCGLRMHDCIGHSGPVPAKFRRPLQNIWWLSSWLSGTNLKVQSLRGSRHDLSRAVWWWRLRWAGRSDFVLPRLYRKDKKAAGLFFPHMASQRK